MEERKGGLQRLDPGVVAWQAEAARNKMARTQKQKRDAARVRVKMDVPLYVKEALAVVAAEEGTSSSQLCGYLLAWVLVLYRTKPRVREAIQLAKEVSRTPRNDFDLVIPVELEDVLRGEG